MSREAAQQPLNQPGRSAASSRERQANVGNAKTASHGATTVFPKSKVEVLLTGPKEIRLAVAVVIVAFILVALVMFNVFFKSSSSPVNATNPQNLSDASGLFPGHTVDAQPIDPKALRADAANQAVRMNQTPASQIDLSMIDRIAGTGTSSIIFFKDGSNMALDPYTMEQLPRAIQLRVSYAQGPQGQSQPPEVQRPPGAPNAR
jgi:hypothetical protein